jgi:hypothetical protein
MGQKLTFPARLVRRWVSLTQIEDGEKVAELGRLNTGNDGGRDTAKRPLLGFQPRYLHLDTGVLPRRSGRGAPTQTEECLLTGLLTLWDVVPAVLLFRGLSRLRARKRYTELLHQ